MTLSGFGAIAHFFHMFCGIHRGDLILAAVGGWEGGLGKAVGL
jgi:hypothetical protein